MGYGDKTYRVIAAWRNWKRCSGVLCDKKMTVKTKGKIDRTVIRPALLFGGRYMVNKEQPRK